MPEFVPEMLPLTVDQVVVWSGVVEMAMGASLILFPRQRRAVGLVLGTFFVAILPGNVAQWKHHRDGFGLNTDSKRFWRLFAQPLPMVWVLWSTGILDEAKRRRLQS